MILKTDTWIIAKLSYFNFLRMYTWFYIPKKEQHPHNVYNVAISFTKILDIFFFFIFYSCIPAAKGKVVSCIFAYHIYLIVKYRLMSLSPK